MRQSKRCADCGVFRALTAFAVVYPPRKSPRYDSYCVACRRRRGRYAQFKRRLTLHAFKHVTPYALREMRQITEELAQLKTREAGV